ncbi:MAG: NAD(P)/FAD-dependent oxidoreductase [Alcanivoracaceae bacterium]
MSDVLIVGAGIAGMLTAVELADRGFSVRLLDDPVAHPPASWAGGGILSPLFPWRYPPALLPLTRHAFADYQMLSARIVAAGGIDPEVDRGGMLVLDDPDPALIRDWAERSGEPVHQGRASDYLPWQGEQAAVWLPGIGRIRNPRLLKGLRHLLAVSAIPVLPLAASRIQLADRGVEVVTPAGVLRADRVVVTAGALSARLLPEGIDTGIHPVRGQMLLYRPEQPLPEAVVLAAEGYLIPRRDGYLLVGSTVEPGIDDSVPTALAQQQLCDRAAQLWPLLADHTPVAQWAGIRPGSRRPLPWIGEVPGSGGRLWLNSGHFRNGLVCGPGSARLLARLMCGEPSDCDPAAYALPSSSSSSPP